MHQTDVVLLRDRIQRMGGEEATLSLGTGDKVWILPIFERCESKFLARLNNVDTSFLCNGFLHQLVMCKSQVLQFCKIYQGVLPY